MPLTEEELNALNKWQGKMDALCKDFAHNQDVLEERLNYFWKCRTQCREEILREITKLKTEQEGAVRRKTLAISIIVAIIASALSGVIVHFLLIMGG